MKKIHTFCIIGLTPFGQTIAKALEEQGNQVLVMDEEEELVQSMSEIATDAIVGDPMKEATLLAAGISSYSCVIVCFSDRLDDSILLTMMLKDMGVPQVVVRAGSELECRIFRKVGADQVVFPEQDMGRKLAASLAKKDVLDYLSYSDEYSIVERRVPKSWIGRNLIECNVRSRYGVNVIALRTGSQITINISPQRPFAEDDVLTLIGSNKGIEKIVKDK